MLSTVLARLSIFIADTGGLAVVTVSSSGVEWDDEAADGGTGLASVAVSG